MAHGHWAFQVIGPDAGAGNGGGSGAGGVFAVHANMDTDGVHLVFDKTYQEIVDAIAQGLLPVVHFPPEPGDGSDSGLLGVFPVDLYGYSTERGAYVISTCTGNLKFATDSTDGYPTYPERSD